MDAIDIASLALHVRSAGASFGAARYASGKQGGSANNKASGPSGLAASLLCQLTLLAASFRATTRSEDRSIGIGRIGAIRELRSTGW